MFCDIKSDYIFRRICYNLKKKYYLEIFRYNKKIQSKANVSIIDYKKHNEIEIEIIPKDLNSVQDKELKLIRFNEEDKNYIHIYFNKNEDLSLQCCQWYHC